ncbi:MAG: hypothetical protein ACKOXB_00945 [Flavobacteriales bacterium]
MKKHPLIPFLFLAVLISACHKKHYETTTVQKVNTDTLGNLHEAIPYESQKDYANAYFEYYPTRDLYAEAYDTLKNMLGQSDPAMKQFKKAVFTVENAWYDGQIQYENFNGYIGQLSTVCRAWVKSNKLDYHEKDSAQINLSAAVFTLMTDTIINTHGVTITFPCRYDFEDYFGAKDWGKMMVCKLLRTNKGNCHSLPYLYKILSEELGVPAYLTLTPNHIFIRQRCQKMSWYNTELTCGRFPIDAWIMSSGYVSTESVVSGIYMDTLDYKQSIALCVNDLAKGYMKKHGKDADLGFVLKCCDLGLRYYPNYAELLLLKAETLRSVYEKEKNPVIYSRMEVIYDTLAKMHYREIPDEMYKEWTNTLDRDSSIYERKETNKNPEALTLSNGRYDEFFQTGVVRRIGYVLFNTETGKIDSFLNREDLLLYRPAETGRWMSVDPVFQPWQSPYTSMDNNPINFNDMFGDCPTCGHGEEVTVGEKNFKRTKVDAGSLSNEQKTMTNIDAWGDGKKREAHDNGNNTYYAKDAEGNYYLLTPADQAQAAKEIFIPTPEAILDDPNGLYKDYTVDQRRQFINSYYEVIDLNFDTHLSHPTISATGSGSTSAQTAGRSAAQSEVKRFVHEYRLATDPMYVIQESLKKYPNPGLKSVDLDIALFFIFPEGRVISGAEKTVAYRYMSEGELMAIKETGYLRGGLKGQTYYTKDLYKSAAKAQERLALKATPTLRIEFEILNNPLLINNGTKVRTNFGFIGGGSEFMTNELIKVRIINMQPLR